MRKKGQLKVFPPRMATEPSDEYLLPKNKKPSPSPPSQNMRKSRKSKRTEPRAKKKDVSAVKKQGTSTPRSLSHAELIKESLRWFQRRREDELKDQQGEKERKAEFSRKLASINQEIRSRNKERFNDSSKTDRLLKKPPCKKKKDETSGFLPKRSKKLSQHSRRRQMGLDFLVLRNSEEIRKLVEASKPPRKEEAAPGHAVAKTNAARQKIQDFIQEKRKKKEKETLQGMIEEFLRVQKIKENLALIRDASVQKRRANLLKPKKKERKPKEKPVRNCQSPLLGCEINERAFSVVQEEYRKIMENWRLGIHPSKFIAVPKEKPPENRVIQKKIPGSDLEQKKARIRDRFKEISRKFETWVQKPRVPEFRDEPSRVPEKDRELQRNLFTFAGQPPPFPERQFEGAEFLAETVKTPSLRQTILGVNSVEMDTLSSEKGPEKCEVFVSIEDIPVNSQFSVENSVVNSALMDENFEVFESIATLIQKTWRGYQTRKILREFFENFPVNGRSEESRKEKNPGFGSLEVLENRFDREIERLNDFMGQRGEVVSANHEEGEIYREKIEKIQGKGWEKERQPLETQGRIDKSEGGSDGNQSQASSEALFDFSKKRKDLKITESSLESIKKSSSIFEQTPFQDFQAKIGGKIPELSISPEFKKAARINSNPEEKPRIPLEKGLEIWVEKPEISGFLGKNARRIDFFPETPLNTQRSRIFIEGIAQCYSDRKPLERICRPSGFEKTSRSEENPGFLERIHRKRSLPLINTM